MHCWTRPFNTQGALERAKRAVENEYAVVGVLEDLNVTLKVLENYIPRFFTGASNVYYGNFAFWIKNAIIPMSNELLIKTKSKKKKLSVCRKHIQCYKYEFIQTASQRNG